MHDSTDLNALYQEWLEIPTDRLPPNHYALLGLQDFESDEATIEAAAKSRSAYLHQLASGPQRKIVQEMLGQVAIARRTLMQPESRDQYDQDLRDSAESPTSDSDTTAATIQPQAPDGPADDAGDRSGQTAAPVKRRSKANEWKYHAISASVLLVIVGVVYWFNRDQGGRRAAQALTGSTDPGTSNATTEAAGPSQPAAPNRTVSSKPAVVVASRGNPSTRSPIAKRRETGSGLGSGLGDKFGSVLSDIANQPRPSQTSDGKPSNDQSTFRPLGKLGLGETRKDLDESEFPSDLIAVTSFPSELKERFDCEQGFDWYTLDGEQLTINTNAGSSSILMTDKEFQLTPGSSIGLTTSVAQKMQRDARVGLSIDGTSFSIGPSKNGIEVFVTAADSESDGASISKFKTSAGSVRLLLQRDSADPEIVRWFVRAADQIHSGSVMIADLDASPATSLFVVTPGKDQKRPLWIGDLGTRAPE